MTETNGWPGKPGVPMNPGLPGAHWLKGYTEDAWMYDGDGGWWGPGYSHNLDAGTVAARYSYLGPCLTPDEATALQARVAELERRAGKEERMTDCIKSEGYIYASLCSEVSRALYEAMKQKRYSKHIAERRAHGGNMSLSDIANTLAELGAHMEVTVKFIDAPDGMEGKKDD